MPRPPAASDAPNDAVGRPNRQPELSKECARAFVPVLLLVLATFAVFFLTLIIGAEQTEHGNRALAFLDPAIGFVRHQGPYSVRWLLERRTHVAWGVTILAFLGTVVGLTSRRVTARLFAVLAAAVVSATWGQVLLLLDQTAAGTALYSIGVVAALVVGISYPLSSIRGFPRLPTPARRRASADESRTAATTHGLQGPWSLPLRWECLLVFLLTVVALLLRAYALTELPSGFDLEMIASMIESRTAHGILRYFDFTFLTTAPGMVHILVQRVFFALLGTSIYSLRAAALFWGVAAVPLFYLLLRRIAGTAPAIASTVLFATAPEQLFWSRTENTFFAAIAVLALLTVHLGLWMVERLTPASVVACALSMPICRYFYVPGFVLFSYPIALLGHTVFFVRGAWRKLWYALPLLAGGAALWAFSLSFVHQWVDGGPRRFIDPTIVYGAPAWRKHGEEAFRRANVFDLARLQIELISNQTAEVVEALTSHGPLMFSHWLDRAHFLPGHMMLMNVALTVTFVLGVGYLLGQYKDRRAFALLMWVGLGLLPGVMSNVPSGRRIAVAFPAVYAIVGVFLAAAVRLGRERGGAGVAALTSCAVCVLVIAITWSNLVSHFSLPIQPVSYSDHIRFTRPLFEESDAIYSNLDERAWRTVQAFGNLDRFLERRPCYQYAPSRDWLRLSLDPTCTFQDEIFALTTSLESVADLQRSYDPQRVSFIVGETLSGREQIAALRSLYPNADVRELRNGSAGLTMVSLTVGIDAVRALQAPTLVTADPAFADLGEVLAGEMLKFVPGKVSPDGHGAVVQAGLLVEHDGWYRFRLDAACPAASLVIDGRPVSGGGAQPMLKGVHDLELRISDVASCTLPFRVLSAEAAGSETPIEAERLVSPSVADVEGMHPLPLVVYPGFGRSDTLAHLTGTLISVQVDGSGQLSVLYWKPGEGWHVDRFTPSGSRLTSWKPDLAEDSGHVALAVAPDGTHFLLSQTTIHVTDARGNSIRRWDLPFGEWATDIALSRDGDVIVVVPSRHSIVVLAPDGTLRDEMKRFPGEPGHFEDPRGVSVSPDGRLLVMQSDGRALLFDPRETTPPFFGLVRTFSVEFGEFPVDSRGTAFDQGERLLIPDRMTGTVLTYSLDGHRMLAVTAAADLGSRDFGRITSFAVGDQAIYALDQTKDRLWRVGR